jgi:hypothetical protein
MMLPGNRSDHTGQGQTKKRRRPEPKPVGLWGERVDTIIRACGWRQAKGHTRFEFSAQAARRGSANSAKPAKAGLGDSTSVGGDTLAGMDAKWTNVPIKRLFAVR